MSVYTSADPTIQPPAHISLFTPPISSSLLVCQYLAPGWLGVWLELFLFKFLLKLLRCVLNMACIEAVHAFSHPQLPAPVLEFQSLSCTL